MINAAWGLGEAIVGGLVTPDTFVMEKAGGTIATAEISEKEMMTVRRASGTHEEPVPANRRRQAVLSPGQAAELESLSLFTVSTFLRGQFRLEYLASLLDRHPHERFDSPNIPLFQDIQQRLMFLLRALKSIMLHTLFRQIDKGIEYTDGSTT